MSDILTRLDFADADPDARADQAQKIVRREVNSGLRVVEAASSVAPDLTYRLGFLVGHGGTGVAGEVHPFSGIFLWNNYRVDMHAATTACAHLRTRLTSPIRQR